MFQNEADYNNAVIDACFANSIEAIAVTDHYRVADSWGLIRLARERGIFVFGGFEAASKDGIHFLCLYDLQKDDSLERFIGEFGIHNNSDLSPNGAKNLFSIFIATQLSVHNCIKFVIKQNLYRVDDWMFKTCCWAE